jgi:osmotically-inducible protein OsmY
MTVTTTRKTDTQIKQDVLNELRWDTRVTETDVGVEVDQGVVTLTGTVPTFMKKMAAEQAAHRVAGVMDVANIAKRVRDTLQWQLFLPNEAVTSTVDQGWVRLKGTVDSFSHRDDALRAVRQLNGVRGITDDITVKPFYSATAPEVREEIEGALDRQAIREANHININVTDGTVRLDGTVRSWPERRAVVNAAKFTPGVRNVDDTRLRVDPYTSF